MAQKVLVQLVDDLDGTSSTDVSTVLFNLDGVSYEIDLTEDHAQRLRDDLADYVASARRVGGRVKRGNKPSAPTASDASKIRQWALRNGFELAGRGRIPTHVVEAYKRAEADKKPSAKATRRSTAQRRTRAKSG